MRFLLIIVIIVGSFSIKSFSQTLFYQDVFYGGVTAGGFSTEQGSGAGVLNLYIEPGSTIRKAYLFSYRAGFPSNSSLIVNGVPFLIDTTNILMSVSHANSNFTPINLYYEDITTYLTNNFTNTFNITIPNQTGLPIGWGWSTVFIFIEYNNSALPKIATSLWVNDKNFVGNEFYNYYNLMPIDNSNPVSFSLYSDRTVDTIFSEGYHSYINSNLLGVIGGSDAVNSLWSGAGVKGHFYYQNNMLFGLDDDTPDSLMGGSDGLADIKSYINNNDTSFDFQLTHQKYPNNLPGRTNVNLAEIITYTTPCDTFSTTATALQDTICLDNSVQLNATGGSIYNWYSPFSTFNDSTLANPMASPLQTTTYIVTIKNDSGCAKTEHVKIWVTQPIDSITTTPTICGNATGSITAHYNTNANYSFTLYDNNFNPLTNNTTGVFNQLPEEIYIVENTLHNCTFYDTITVNAINNVIANFYSFPQAPWNNPNQPLGKAPMEVSFFNTSQNANTYLWSITQQPNNDTIVEIPNCTGITSSCGLQHFFTEGGTFEVCLIAYNNQPQCADTVCKTIFIDANENVSVFIPNVFTPNGDNENDNFIIQLIGAEYLESLEVAIFNRWGQQISNYKLEIGNSISNLESPISNLTIWNGTTTAGNKASEGTYFYIISYTTKAGETVTEKGTVSLLR
ncbi:MAG: gliding motility-associated C-terminal domain-containing protein [Vicingaceae bacterium]|nr:gliding motility-associated C-terminal domain-containing protein [Vicingaceae bacterium]